MGPPQDLIVGHSGQLVREPRVSLGESFTVVGQGSKFTHYGTSTGAGTGGASFGPEVVGREGGQGATGVACLGGGRVRSRDFFSRDVTDPWREETWAQRAEIEADSFSSTAGGWRGCDG